MKKIIAALAVLGVFAIAEATSIPVAENTMTVYTVQVTSTSATAVPSATNLMKNRTVVYLQNQDPTYDVFCATSVVTSTATNTFMLSDANEVVRLDVRGFPLYCITEGDVTHSTVTIIQAY